MAKNTKFWKTHLAKSDDKKYAAATGEDPLEEGLKDLTWFENSRRAVKRGLHKTYETFGEEVGNSITTGVPALYLLGLLPFASINTYLTAAAKPGATPASIVMSVIGISAFIITLFLALLFATIYHFMKHGTPHKRVMNKINRSVAYFAILGAYTPICIHFMGVVSGAVLWALEAAAADKAEALEAAAAEKAEALEAAAAAAAEDKAQALEAAAEDKAQALEAAETQRLADLEAAENQRLADLEAAENQRLADLEAAENQRLQDLENLAKEHEIEIKDIRKAHRVELLKLKKVLEEDLEKLQAEYEITEEELNNASEDDAELIQQIKDKIVNLKEQINQQAELIEELNHLLGNRGYEFNEEGDVIYTVTKGDTLAKICAKCGLDYWKNSAEILEINGLKNENEIFIGQILKLPG